MATLLLSVLGAFAEFERTLIRERQQEGIALAKKRGVYKGRKPSLRPDQVAELRQKAQAGAKKAGLAREYGISRETVPESPEDRTSGPHPTCRNPPAGVYHSSYSDSVRKPARYTEGTRPPCFAG